MFKPFKRFKKRREWLAKLITIIIKLLLKTLRYRAVGASISEVGVIGFLHGHQLPLLLHKPQGHLVTPISRSVDGELQVLVMRYFGVDHVRGSSSRGAVSALRGLTKALNAGSTLLIALDGPRGPYGVPKRGATSLALRHKTPFWFCHVRCSSAITLKTWDRFCIPLPFSKVTVCTHRVSIDESLNIETAHSQVSRQIKDACDRC
jgi:Kdo2-lipid IVA 3' secondary acyltransferase